MRVGIIANNCHSCTFTGEIDGAETGMEIQDSSQISINRMDFKRVKTAVRARRVDGLTATGNAHSEVSQIRLKPLVILVRAYISTLRKP